MSWAASNDEFSVFPGEVLRARPLGSLAAALIGVVAIVVLVGCWLFVRPAPVEPVAASFDIPAEPAPARSALRAAPQSATAALARPAGVDLDAPDFVTEKKVSFTERDAGGGRRDTLVFGDFADGRFYLRLDALQPGGEKIGSSDFYLDMARHASRAGLAVVRIGPPAPLATRFGAFETAEMRAARAVEGGAAAAGSERACLAFRLASPKSALELAGFSCGAGAKPLDRRTLGCLIDRLRYIPAAEDRLLEQFFLKGELERAQTCVVGPASGESETAPGHGAAKKKRAAKH